MFHDIYNFSFTSIKTLMYSLHATISISSIQPRNATIFKTVLETVEERNIFDECDWRQYIQLFFLLYRNIPRECLRIIWSVNRHKTEFASLIHSVSHRSLFSILRLQILLMIFFYSVIQVNCNSFPRIVPLFPDVVFLACFKMLFTTIV